jgi:hypothetical protein
VIYLYCDLSWLGRGRPSLVITREQLLTFHNMGYTALRMSKHFGCSVHTGSTRIIMSCSLSCAVKALSYQLCHFDAHTFAQNNNAWKKMLTMVICFVVSLCSVLAGIQCSWHEAKLHQGKITGQSVYDWNRCKFDLI